MRVGSPVHGGHCLARVDGRVLFVRHALPGELVRVRLTSRGKVWRGDAVEVLEPSDDRVTPAWEAAGPGGVGGVELAHATLAAQRAWKGAVIVDALRRIGRGVALEGRQQMPVAAAPGESDGWGTRTRIELTADSRGRAGMHAYRSHRVVPLTSMPLAVPALAGLGLFERRWRPGARIEAVAPSAGEPVVLVDGAAEQGPAGARPSMVTEEASVAGRRHRWQVPAGGFWQTHRAAPALLAQTVLAAAGSLEGATVLDLYSGSGLLTSPLAVAAGRRGQVIALEGDRRAAAAARANARGTENITARRGDVLTELRTGRGLPPEADVVVLDPPRAGAGHAVLEQVVLLRPHRIVYVSCDPAALARDLCTLADLGLAVRSLQAFDLFPHTHHVEAVAVLEQG